MKQKLIEFEERVARLFENKQIPGPIHLSGGNEDQLISIFDGIKKRDYVFSTWRSHYHALLHGVPEPLIMTEILSGRSMNLTFPSYNFYTSAIVGGTLPIATGVAQALKGTDREVWCFIGDMAATTGIFRESLAYADKHDLPIHFIIEDNGVSCNTPTYQTTQPLPYHGMKVYKYYYSRSVPHCGIGKWVTF